LKRYVIVDLDGTCSNAVNRQHLVDGSQKRDWDKFYDQCGEDEAHEDVINLVRVLKDAGYVIVLMTGRVQRVRGRTLMWLTAKNFPAFEALWMRPDGDTRQDCILKAELAAKAGLTPENTFLILDDRDQVVRMWRRLGFRCLQVANGNF
jgi:hypothetical protein